ncbi:peptidoglycan L-alanyl-D-glutamate endopeptidase CwlK [Amphibacillus marinus]|uniref:Peptidoglycan L-alanyl-D-glutamate endopeptidase CwlK n=1 Tax=Amphibacillus marinus TaxID=872970 RepID=A0A1H8IQV8_9BACI|nr:M15 family metallopeptidase [Amphibacillus marinus]SEN71043.1 peptidoglycan L-alanyl-D-glutamate endopeptidase CwlK [Amphibacillus marinus]
MTVKKILLVGFTILIAVVAIRSVQFYQLISSRNQPSELHPIIVEHMETLITQAKQVGIDVVITDGFRSFEEQEQLYEQGRSNEGSIVTNAQAGQSYHNYGLAIDFALQNQAGDIIWDMAYDGNQNGESDWLEVVELAKALGFDWGGDWRHFPDYPHLQMDFGLTILQLQHGYRPGDSLLAFIFFLN